MTGAQSPAFQGDTFRRNLHIVDRLRKLATDELGITLAQLAIGWTLANPVVDVAIVGTRDPLHVDETVAAADLHLDDSVLDEIAEIMVTPYPWLARHPRECEGRPS